MSSDFENEKKEIKAVLEKLGATIDEVLETKISILIRKCVNYMNREDLPEKLIEVLAEYTFAEYSYLGNDGNIKAETIGSTKIEYVSNKLNMDNVFGELRGQLNKFRRLGVPGDVK